MGPRMIIQSNDDRPMSIDAAIVSGTPNDVPVSGTARVVTVKSKVARRKQVTRRKSRARSVAGQLRLVTTMHCS